jgi:ATP-dependent Clp protease ATP-binding subunit ClpB
LGEQADSATVKAAVMDAVGQHFRPEFINRIDEVVVFHALGQGQIRGIADIQLDRLRSRLKEREIGLQLDDAAFEQLVKVGYDPVFGARPLKRAIQSEIENPLAQSILAGQFASGDVVQITGSEYGLKFEPIKYH